VETLELLEQEASIGGRATNRSPRKSWSMALLFERPCADPEEVATSLTLSLTLAFDPSP